MAELLRFFRNKRENMFLSVREEAPCCSLATWHLAFCFFLGILESSSNVCYDTEQNNIFSARNVCRKICRIVGKEFSSTLFVFWRCIFPTLLDFLPVTPCCIRANFLGYCEPSSYECSSPNSKHAAPFSYKIRQRTPCIERGLRFYLLRTSSTTLRMISDTLTPSSLARSLIHLYCGFVKTMPRWTPLPSYMPVSRWFYMDYITLSPKACQ